MAPVAAVQAQKPVRQDAAFKEGFEVATRLRGRPPRHSDQATSTCTVQRKAPS